MGTQLYDQSNKPIYPSCRDTDVSSAVIQNTSTVEQALRYLNDIVQQQLSGNSLTISFNSTYCINNETSMNDNKAQGCIWNPQFILPTQEAVYTWRKLEIFLGGGTNKALISTIYEIVMTAELERVQTLYRVTSEGTTSLGKPTVENNGTISNYNNWSEFPTAISETTPNLYTITRIMKNGKWEDFGDPVLSGKYAYNSQILIKYKITDISSDEPNINRTAVNPNGDNTGDDPELYWVDNINQQFSGKLWMTTATSVNSVPTKFGDYIWSKPTLISIVQ